MYIIYQKPCRSIIISNIVYILYYYLFQGIKNYSLLLNKKLLSD